MMDANFQDIKEVEWNTWDFDYLNISAYGSGKKNLYGNSEDHIEHNTGARKMDYLPVDLTSVIQNLYEKTDSPRATLPSQNSVNNGREMDQLEKSSADGNADIDFDQFDWEFQNAAEIGEAENTGAYESDQGLANESTSYTLVDIYCRLKKESLALIVHHLAVLKVSICMMRTLDSLSFCANYKDNLMSEILLGSCSSRSNA